MLLLVALLAATAIAATMAYTGAKISSPVSATVVRTDVALLALDCNPGLGKNDGTCELNADGRLHLHFAKGLTEGGTPGTDPIPGHWEPTIALVNAKTQGNRFEVQVIDSNGNEHEFQTSEQVGTNQFRYEIVDDEPHCLEYEVRAKDIWHGPEKWCIPGATYIPGDEGTPGTPGSGLYGFQPGSTYTFTDLVRITNHSADAVNVSVSMDLELPVEVTNPGGADLTSGTHYLAPGDSVLVSFAFTVPDEWGSPDKFPNGDEQYPFTGTMVINAVATAP